MIDNQKKYIKFVYHLFGYSILKIKYFVICLKNDKRDVIEKKYKNLLINNMQGGGTRKYINGFLQENKNTLVVEIVSYVWPICYCVYDSDKNKKIYVSLNTFSKYILNKKFEIIYVNSLAFFRNIFQIQDLLIKYKKNNNVKLVYMVHDYHSVCPNLNLVKNDQYCKLSCDNTCDLEITYGGLNSVGISNWRKQWHTFFDYVDEIRCFSESSRKILSRVYDNIDNKVLVIPHKNNDVIFNEINVPINRCVIGIVGTINNVAKGINECRFLINNIDSNIKIIFIGTKKEEINLEKENVVYLGRYEKESLESIIKKQEINTFIFPSICPETFSYVISELMMFNLPILSFNVGAQGERVSNYSKGMVFSNSREMVQYINLKNKNIR